MDADFAQAAAAHRHREKLIEYVEFLDVGILAMRHDVHPRGAVAVCADGRGTQAKIASLPVGPDYGLLPKMLDVVFMIGFSRLEDLKGHLTIVGSLVKPLR